MAKLLKSVEESFTLFLHELNNKGIKFSYGTNDCGIWVCDWVKFYSGKDPAKNIRGTYNTELGCAKMLKREGGSLIYVLQNNFLKCNLNFKVINYKSFDIKPGDICVLNINGELVAGMFCTYYIVMMKQGSGLYFINKNAFYKKIKFVWRLI